MKRRWHGDPFKILPDDTAALRRCCRAFAHTVDQGGSEQVGAVGNWIGGGPAHQPFLIGNRLLLHISPCAEHAIYVYPPMVETERLTEKHRLRARN